MMSDKNLPLHKLALYRSTIAVRRSLNKLRPRGRVAVLAMIFAVALSGARAEDSDRFRPYFRFHSGDIEPLWGVDDHWSLGLGANFNRYVGAELAFDYYLKDWGEPNTVGEASSYHWVPEVRLRYPLFGDRLVPYIIAGIGPSWVQSKDVTSGAFDLHPRVEGWSYTVAAGAGLEYFIADNITFGIEGRYFWVNSVDGEVGGERQSADLSAALFTFGLRVYFDENHPQPFLSTMDNPPSRFYFGVRLGADMLTDDDWVSGVTLKPEQAAWGGIGGQTGGLLLGVDLGKHFGFELAGDHINHRIDVEDLGVPAEYGQGWVLGNLRLRFPTGRITPYVYAGGGLVYSEYKDFMRASEGIDLEGEKWHPAANIGGGVEYFVTHNFSVNADVRWAYTWNHTFGIDGLVPTQKGDYSYVAATIGFRVYLFHL